MQRCFQLSETPPSQAKLARIAGVENATIRSNINMLLKMVIGQGWEIDESKTPTELYNKGKRWQNQ